MSTANLSIGQRACRAEVSLDTVRYCERHGLLDPAVRRAPRYRRHGRVELKRLHFIRRAKARGLTLRDIRKRLALSAGRDVGKIKRTAQTKPMQIDVRIAELARIRIGLHRLIQACAGHVRVDDCPILDAPSDEECP